MTVKRAQKDEMSLVNRGLIKPGMPRVSEQVHEPGQISCAATAATAPIKRVRLENFFSSFDFHFIILEGEKV